jgi:hypothetical protein
MSYAVESREVTGAPVVCAVLGGRVELRELNYGEVTDLVRAAGLESMAFALLGAALHIDGVALGLEGLRALPGRCARELGDLMGQALAMHGFEAPRSGAAAGAPGNGHDSATPVIGAASGEELAPGEVWPR